MAESMQGENAAFWLPSHFLTDDDFLYPTQTNLHNNYRTTKCYDVFNSGFGSDPFLDSPHTIDKPADDDEQQDPDLLSELTRHLARSSLRDSSHNNEKGRTMSTSPQSTLTGFGPWSSRSGFSNNGSPNGPSQAPSPPLTPELKNDAAWDLLYEAAGQVAQLKMNAIAAHIKHRSNHALLTAPRHPNQYEQVKWAQEKKHEERENQNKWYCPYHNHQHEYSQQQRSSGGSVGYQQSAWPPLSQRQTAYSQHRQGNCTTSGAQMRGIYLGGMRGGAAVVGPTGGVKRQSAGTGVFLPRRVSTTPPRQHYQPEARNKAADIMVARRNAVERRNLMRSHDNAGTMVGPTHEIRLPSDWTY